MNREKKFPVILLCFTLILAVFVSGITVPGFLLPLFSYRAPSAPKSNDLVIPPVQLTGSSHAFSIDPEPGVRVYAGENALDRDREFNVSRLSDDDMDRYYRELAEAETSDDDLLLIAGWEVDAGIEDGEFMPGGFSMDFDLREFGVPEELWEDITVYRRDGEGLWYEYATWLSGSVVSINSRQNCPLFLALPAIASKLGTIALWLAPAVAGKLLNDTALFQTWPLWFMEGYPVYIDYSYDEVLDKYEKRGGLSTFFEHRRQIGTLKFRAYEIDANLDEKIRIRTTEIGRVECKTESFLKEVKEITILNYGENYKQEDYNNVYVIMKKDKLIADPEYQKLMDQKLSYLKDRNLSVSTIEKMKEIYVTAYKYLDLQTDTRMPSYNVDVYVTEVDNAMTVTTYPFGYAYVVVNIKGLDLEQKSNDDILVTLTHELTHVSQREYCTSAASCLKFDEATATVMEKLCSDYYYRNNIIAKEYTISNAQKVGFYGCEMDNYSYKTQLDPSSGLKSGSVDKSDSAYPYALFVKYLIDKDYPGDSLSWNRIFSGYNSWSTYIENFGDVPLSALLKAAFPSVDTEDKLTGEFTEFAKKNKTLFYEYALNNKGTYFSPSAGLENKNGAKTLIQNQDYTIKVRFITPTKKEGVSDSSKVALRIVQEKFGDRLHDTVLVPVGITDVAPVQGGLFYSPRSLSSLGEQAAILEIDGGNYPAVAPNEPGMLIVWTLYAPDKVTPEKKDEQIRIKMPELSDAAKEGLIDGYRVTVTPSRGGTKKEFHWNIGIAGKYVSLNYSDILDQDFMKDIREGKEDKGSVDFRVSISEYFESYDGNTRRLTKYYGPESDEDSVEALLAEMGAHDGRITITLHWEGPDDLDLHCTTPKGGHISYNNKSADGGYLDVDMNVHGESTNSVEHIYFDAPETGEYSIYIDNYTDRTDGDTIADIVVKVEQKELMRKTVSMGGRSPTWKFRIEPAPGLREGIEYYVGTIVETGDGDRLDG